MTEPDRAEAMARRLARTVRRLGVAEEDRVVVLEAFRAAMEPRRARIHQDHLPDFLHPARTALILMDDVAESDPVTLAAAMFTETRDPTLLPAEETRARISPEATALAAAVPVPAWTDHLLEALLALPDPGMRVAAAERLDQVRHLHLRPRKEWAGWHAETGAVYVPATARIDATLAARLDWWCDMFARRFMET